MTQVIIDLAASAAATAADVASLRSEISSLRESLSRNDADCRERDRRSEARSRDMQKQIGQISDKLRDVELESARTSPRPDAQSGGTSKWWMVSIVGVATFMLVVLFAVVLQFASGVAPNPATIPRPSAIRESE